MIKERHPGAVVDLIEGGRGDFIVTRLDGADAPRELWNKRAVQDQHPRPEQILEQL
ncbi:MAG: hypothetical protein AAGN82_26580 [Myxococcota bacterium]